jgi:tetratricopeptide (TPR) repeat protein
VAQALADTGIVGVVASALLLVAWLAAALRTTGLLPRFRRFGVAFRRRDWDAERIALVGMLLVAVVFGLQSAIDWTWFVPGPAVMALVAAGFVAGRGPVGALAGAPAAGIPARPPVRRKLRLLRPVNEPGRFVVAAGIGACALLFAWAIWQPEASDRASNRALELAEARDYQEALAKADDAGRANPLSPRPLFVRAVAQTQAGDLKGARASLERAVLRFPGDPQTWLRLATFQLGTLDRPTQALATLEAVLYLDPLSKAGRSLFYEARDRARVQAARAG